MKTLIWAAFALLALIWTGLAAASAGLAEWLIGAVASGEATQVAADAATTIGQWPVPAGAVTATLRRALVLDPVVRLELEPSHGERELIEARLATAAFDQLGLREGDAVLVSPRNSVGQLQSVEA